MSPANCCKRLTKRRLFARAAVAALEQSALDRRRGSRSSASRWARTAPRSPSLCLAALQSMRTTLGRQQHSIVRYSYIMRRFAYVAIIVAELAGTVRVCAVSPELPSLRRSDGVELKVSPE